MFADVLLILIVIFLLVLDIHRILNRLSIPIFRHITGNFSTRLSSITERLCGTILDPLDQIAGLSDFPSLRLLVHHFVDLSDL